MEVSIECQDRDVLSAEISPPRKTDDVQMRGRLTRKTALCIEAIEHFICYKLFVLTQALQLMIAL